MPLPAPAIATTDNVPLRVVCLSAHPPLHATLQAAFATPDLTGNGGVSLVFANPADQKAVAEALKDADAVFCDRFSPQSRLLAPRLRWVQFWSAGADGSLFPELWENGVVVTTGSGIHAASGAEHVLSLMLAFARGLPQTFAAQQNRDWKAGRRAAADAIFELEGKTVGIVGAGVIGQAIGKRCQAFGMRTVGTRRDPTQPTEGIDVLLSHIQYHDLILESDMIVLALPLTASTRMMFGEDEIEILRKGTYLFNIGRGGLIDEKWVIRALEKGWLAGAGLDVFENEPLPTDSPFWTLPNCVVTPHIGGQTPRYWIRFAGLAADQTRRFRAGIPLLNQVDKNLGY